MKTIIKQYNHPKVDSNLLSIILQQHKRKNILLILLQYIAISIIFMLFIQNLVGLNIEYLSVFSSLGNIGLLIQVIVQIIVGIIHFIFNNIYLIFGLFLLSFVSNIYSIQE